MSKISPTLKPWLSINEACQEFQFTRASLEQWRRKGCMLLGGRKPQARREQLPDQQGCHRWQYVFIREDLEAIAATRDRGGKREADDGQWLTAAEAAEEFGVS